MATEAKRKFGNQELDVLDEIRFLLESQADLMDPAGDQTITAARGFSSVKADILDRIRRATERQFKHAGSIFSGDVITTGIQPQLITEIDSQHEEMIQSGVTYNDLTTSYEAMSGSVITLNASVYPIQENPNKITLTDCDVATDNGTYTITNHVEDILNFRILVSVAEVITGGSTVGTAKLYNSNYRPVVTAATGLAVGTTFSIVGSDNADAEYTFTSESSFDDNGTTKYYITTVETVPLCAVFGSIYSVEVVNNLSITNPFNSLFTTLHLWNSAGTDIYSGIAHLITKTAGQFTIPGTSLSQLGLHVDDSIHYSIDSHV